MQRNFKTRFKVCQIIRNGPETYENGDSPQSDVSICLLIAVEYILRIPCKF